VYRTSWVQVGIHAGATRLHVVLGSPDGCYYSCKRARGVRGCCRGPGCRAAGGEVSEFLEESSKISSSKLSYFGKEE